MPCLTRGAWRSLRALPVRWLLAAAAALLISLAISPAAFGYPSAGATALTSQAAESGHPALRYRWFMAMAIVGSVQIVLVAALLWQRRQLRLAEQALLSRDTTLQASRSRTQALAGALLHAQEAARIALAQDLHDDIGQDIIGIAMSLDTVVRSGGRIQDPKNQYALSQLHEGVLAVATRVRQISHELHPATLQLLGLAPAVKAHCFEVESRYHAQVALQTAGDMTSIHPTTALCLFRVAQESLRNAVVHGAARHIEVSLTRFGDDIELAVRDDGRGFDVESTRRDSRGLGLLTMEERVRTAGGEVMVWSKPVEGTTVLACVPAGQPSQPQDHLAWRTEPSWHRTATSQRQRLA